MGYFIKLITKYEICYNQSNHTNKIKTIEAFIKFNFKCKNPCVVALQITHRYKFFIYTEPCRYDFVPGACTFTILPPLL